MARQPDHAGSGLALGSPSAAAPASSVQASARSVTSDELSAAKMSAVRDQSVSTWARVCARAAVMRSSKAGTWAPRRWVRDRAAVGFDDFAVI